MTRNIAWTNQNVESDGAFLLVVDRDSQSQLSFAAAAAADDDDEKLVLEAYHKVIRCEKICGKQHCDLIS